MIENGPYLFLMSELLNYVELLKPVSVFIFFLSSFSGHGDQSLFSSLHPSLLHWLPQEPTEWRRSWQLITIHNSVSIKIKSVFSMSECMYYNFHYIIRFKMCIFLLSTGPTAALQRQCTWRRVSFRTTRTFCRQTRIRHSSVGRTSTSSGLLV